jgi:hypothetical protein
VVPVVSYETLVRDTVRIKLADVNVRGSGEIRCVP